MIPAFTKGKEQLDSIDVEKTRGIAHVRIDVDLLTCNPHGNPEVQVPMIDRIIRVRSGLVNLCGPIVPFD